MKRKTIAYAITIILFAGFLFLFWKIHNIAFLVISIVIAGLWLLLFTLGKLVNANGKPLKDLTMAEAKKKIASHKDTSSWSPTRGVITRFVPLNKIIENGQTVAQLYYF